MAITNIVGEGFAEEIRKQIDKRQELKGKRDRNPGGNPQWLLWQNGNTGWVKMISSVDIDPEKKYFTYLPLEDGNPTNPKIIPTYTSGRGGIFEYGNSGRGSTTNGLAATNILMGGIYAPTLGNLEENNYLQAGIARNGSFQNTNAYGFGGLEFGLQPIPGITSFNIKSENRGSLRTATVGIKAYNKVQFDIISTLYMSLGYTMLIEWGNTMYYDNGGKFYSNNQFSLQEEFLNAKYKWTELLPEIKKRQLESNGNYDAALCRVVNFNWKLNKDMSYEITVILRSVGDVIESLKINTLSTNVVTKSKLSFFNLFPKNPNNSNTIEAINNVLQIPQLQIPTVINYQNQLTNNNNTLSLLNGQPVATIINSANTTDIGIFLEDIKTQLDNITTPGKVKNGNTYGNGHEYVLADKEGNALAFKEVPIANSTPLDYNYYYIKLGYFLFLLETKIIPNIKDNPELKSISIDYHNNSNIISIDDELVSADPRICTFQQVIQTFDGVNDILISPAADKFKFEKNNNSYGYFMNVYFEINFLNNLLTNTLPDKDGAVVLIDFLNKLCNDFCLVTGNYNKITTTVDYDTQTIRFIDEVSLPDRDTFLTENGLPTEPANFHMYGYFPVKGSDLVEAGIVRDLSLVTTISPRLAHMISIGAQAQGYAIGEDATALSALNRGLKDRIRDDWYYPGQTSSNPTEKTLKDQYAIVYENFYKFVETLGVVLTPNLRIYQISNSVSVTGDDIDVFKNTNRQFIEYKQAKATLEKQKTNPNAASSRTGFLPFNLSLTIDGLSGMKIYNRFTADTEYLPPNYPDTIEFIITGLSHEIKDNQWVTNIESLAIPKNPLNGNIKTIPPSKQRGDNFNTIPTKQPNPTTANPNPKPTLKQAVKDQSNYFFGNFGESKLCARYAYNIAYNLKKYMDTNSTQAIPQTIQYSANADQLAWRTAVNKLDFYEQVDLGYMNLTQLKAWTDSSTFNYGDILNYYAPGHSGETNMHAQIYTGDIFSLGKSYDEIKKGLATSSRGNSGWTSSTKTNYGKKIVYDNSYTFKVFYFKVKSQYLK
jgi:hypothetical protein